MKQAVILGAGFSLAVSPVMPSTNQLAKLVLDRLEDEGVAVRRRPGGEGFEAWLSRLAEAQPDRTTAENLDNQALFVRVAGALRETVVELQQDVLASDPPWWLRRFVGALHYSGSSTVITFNYDMLVEYALEWCRLFDHDDVRVLMSSALRYGPTRPYQPATGISHGEQRAETFDLLKLHGSVDAYWVPGDVSGATINRWDPGTRWRQPVVPSDDERREVLPGREPFLIPPAAAKSAFYANPVSRELWQRAAAAIGQADEVVLIGYSLPMTDLVTSGMLADRLRDSSSNIVVVNPDGDGVQKALGVLGIEASRVTVFDNVHTGCSDYVSTLEERFEPGWDWPDLDAQSTVSVGRAGTSEYAVTGVVDAVGGVVTLSVDDTRLTLSGPVPGPTVGEVQAAVGTPNPKVILRWPDGNESWVAQAVPKKGPSGATEGLVFVATALPAIAPVP
jgi:hypothetical protein